VIRFSALEVTIWRQLMNNPLNMDLSARAELLTYLVASNLLARELTGQWLSVKHLVESTRIWLEGNSAGTDIFERIRLVSKAHDLTRKFESGKDTPLNTAPIKDMLVDGMKLDFRSPLVKEAYGLCRSHLIGEWWR
jgi:hypothetical protein